MSDKWIRRENKQKAKKNRMPKHGMSVLTIEIIVQRKANKAKTIIRNKKRKDKM